MRWPWKREWPIAYGRPPPPPRGIRYYRCSFCLRDNSDGRKMIAGHEGNSCYDCIDLVSEIKREAEQG